MMKNSNLYNESGIFNLKKLPLHAKFVLLKAIRPSFLKIFTEKTFSQFEQYVVNNSPLLSKLKIFEDQGNIVGFANIQVFKEIINSKHCIIIRGQAGFIAAYRGKGLLKKFIMNEIAKIGLLYSLRKNVYLIAFLIHPSVYRFFQKNFKNYFPHPNKKTPNNIQIIFDKYLGKALNEFNANNIRRNNKAFVIPTECKVVETKTWENYKEDGNDQSTFFYKNNPYYKNGDGFMVVAPITFCKSILTFISITLKYRGKY